MANYGSMFLVISTFNLSACTQNKLCLSYDVLYLNCNLEPTLINSFIKTLLLLDKHDKWLCILFGVPSDITISHLLAQCRF